jgi:hypothetical protein
VARPGPVKRLVAGMQALQGLDKKVGALEAVVIARRIREAAEDLEQAKVDEARRRGASWREIGSVYDISKQAAHQRFAPDVRSGPSAALRTGEANQPGA